MNNYLVPSYGVKSFHLAYTDTQIHQTTLEIDWTS
jgi:hypothetical protein